MLKNRPVAALDVGSTKICCFLGQIDPDGGIRVLGAMQRASAGVRNGCVASLEETRHAVLATVSAAEEMAGERIDRVLVNLSGGPFFSETQEIELLISGHEIAASDLAHARQRNAQIALPRELALIHSLPVRYAVDGNAGIRDPLGMFGERLRVGFHRVTAAAGPARSLRGCVDRCLLEVEDVVISPYAAGLACLVEDEKDLGAAVVDMGGGTTTIAVFHEGRMVFADSIPVGGGHVTSDIARGLSTPIAHAERLKILHGNAMPSPADDEEIVDVPLLGEDGHDQANHVPRSLLSGIMCPRVEETLELVRERLEMSGAGRLAGRRLVLTGGASQLQGLPRLAELVLERQVRIGRPLRLGGLAEASSGPAFSACAGLLRYAAEKSAGAIDDVAPGNAGRKGRMALLGQWLRENF